MFEEYKKLIGKKEEKKKIERKGLFSRMIGGIKNEFQVVVKEDKTQEKKVKIKSNPQIIVTKTKKPELPQITKESFKKDKKINNPFFFLLKIFIMVKKDFKILLRSKTSSLILLFGPLFIIFLVGTSFNTTSLYDLKVGVYSEAYSDLSTSLINNLKDRQYNTIKAGSEQACIDGVKFGVFNVCVVFPPGMAVSNDVTNDISVYVDKSRINIAYIVSNDIFKKVEEKSSELSLGLTADLLGKLESTKTGIDKAKPLVTNVIGGNSDNSLKLRTVKDNFNSLDLGYSNITFNFTGVDDEISSIRTQYNISSTVFRRVNDRLSEIKTSTDTLKSKLSKAASSRDNYAKDISTVDTALQDDIKSLNELKSSLDSLITDLGSISITKAETITSPIKTTVKAVTSEESHLTNIFPTLLILMIMLIGIVISSTLIISEKKSSAYFRNFITPTLSPTFLISNFITNFLIIIIEIAILFGVASYFMQNKLYVIPQMFAIMLLCGVVFILIGMFIGYVFTSEETANLAAISAGSIMLFFSNTILPMETLSGVVRKIVIYNPFVIGESALKKLILYDVALESLTREIYLLLLFAFIFLALTFIARQRTKTRK